MTTVLGPSCVIENMFIRLKTFLVFFTNKVKFMVYYIGVSSSLKCLWL